MRSLRTLNPAIEVSASWREAAASTWIDCSRFSAITGSITLSWKLPDWPAIVIVVSLPMTCAHTIVVASAITGFTLPGMIDEPGCSAGSSISPRPASGPEFIQRRSFAIFMSAHASVRNWPESSTEESCAEMFSKKLSPDSNLKPVALVSSAATVLPNFSSALMPVPTAVPPSGRRRRRFSESSMRSIAVRICADQPPSSCPNVTGIASIRCVRPVFATFASSFARLSIVLRRCASAGNSVSCVARQPDTWIAVGITSFDDCPMFTWSFGCTLRPDARVARFAMTSFAFMLLLVPEPVWNTSIGKCTSCSPAATAVAAAAIAFASPFFMWPSVAFAEAHAPLIRPSARMNSRGIGMPEIGKFCTARCVVAPYSASAGTCSSPMLSFSMRYFAMSLSPCPRGRR